MATKNHAICNLVAELNAALGVAYFKVEYYESLKLYELQATEQDGRTHKFDYLLREPIRYSDMLAYLTGVLLGFRAARDAAR